MTWKKWLKPKRVPLEELPLHDCPNCGTAFQGHFCPNCGQSTTEFDRPFGFVFYDFMGNLFSFDSRFFRTFRFLALRPGFLTAEFLRGRRERYAPPFRIFIFLSFILFLMLQVLTDRALEQPGTTNGLPDSVQVTDSVDIDPGKLVWVKTLAEPDSVQHQAGSPADSLLASSGSVEQRMKTIASRMQHKADRSDDPDQRKMIQIMVNVLNAPRQMAANILKYLSWAFFAMLPVFALLLALIYLRRRQHFIRYLVFSVHVHSFVFLLHILLVLSVLLFHHLPGWIYLLALLLIQLYIYLALKRFYGQGYLKTAFKFLLMGFLYATILSATTVWVFYNAFRHF